MRDKLRAIWNDPVWSKVIATLIAAAILTAVAAFWEKHSNGTVNIIQASVPLWSLIALTFGTFIFSVLILSRQLRRSYRFSPRIKLISVEPQRDPNPSAGFPQKCYFHFRNDSQGCIDVSLSDFEPDAVKIRGLGVAVLQVQMNQQYFSVPNGVSRIAVLPGQLFRGWIAPDEKLFNNDQLKALVGKLGTLVLSINGERVFSKI